MFTLLGLLDEKLDAKRDKSLFAPDNDQRRVTDRGQIRGKI
jgi:hypothetical protein